MRKFYISSAIALIFSLSFNSLSAQSPQTFSYIGGVQTWTCPAGVTSLQIECWGAGGGGGNSDNGTGRGGSGGGGGAYCKSTLCVVPGNTYYIMVGGGGTGAPANSTSPATAGGNSWFNTSNSAPTSTAGVLAGGGGLGGNNGGAVGAAGAATYFLTTGTAGSAGVAGGNSGGGDGGAGANGGAGGLGSTSSNGGNGTVPGGGGGGSDDVAAMYGGNGANGRVILTWTAISLSATSAITPVSAGSSSTVTLTGGLPVGTYTVTYNLSAPNAATGLTATMTVSTAGTGTFTTSALANVGTTTLTVTGIQLGSCSNNTISSNNTASIVTTAAYCTPSGSSSSYYINDFSTTGGTTNITNNGSGFSASGYGNFTGLTVTQMQGSTVNFSAAFTGGTFGFSIWVDWNHDADFADAGEQVYVTSAYASTASGSFTVPITALTGNTRMRIHAHYTNTAPSNPCATSISGEFEDYTFNVTALPTCSGTPAPGNTVSSANPVCAGVSFTLSMSNTLSYSGITYQWQSSPDNITWTDIAGQTSVTYTGTQSAATYYRCLVTCTASGLSASSTALLENMTAFTSCYCTSSATSTSDMDITNITFGTINNTSATVSLTGTQGTATGTAGMYSNWTASAVPVPSFMQGSTNTFSVTIGGTAYSHQVVVYIDFNHNGLFTDAGESFTAFAYANPALPNSSSISITIPITASTGNTRMRVVCVESSSVSSCGTYTWGETEDYMINITLATPCSGTPTGGTAVASVNTGCTGYTSVLTVTGATIASGMTYQWQSSPDNITWTDIPGVTTETYTPTVTSTLYYRRVITCTSSGISSNSSSVLLSVNSFLLCYCTSSATSTSDMDVTNITFGSINNTSATVSLTGTQGTATGTAGMYSDWRSSTVPVPTFMQGSTNAFSVTIGGTAYSHRVVVYIDFNHNGSFADAGEQFDIFAYANPTLPNTTTSSITIPISALTGNTGMRVVCVESSSASCCGTYTWGETEDYIVNITLATPCSGAPTGGTTAATVTNGCSGYTSILSVSGSTVASGLTYQWQSSPDNITWTDIPGATSELYTATVTANTYYRRIVTCTSSGISANSSSVQATIISVPNDECANAIALTVNADFNCGTVTHGSTQCATQSLAGCAGTADDDVWFSFVATNTRHKISILNVTGTTDVVFQVFSGTCGSLTSVLCSDPNTGDATGLTIGATYYVRVYTYSSGASYYANFDVCVGTPPPPPSNDECTAPIVLPVNPANTCNNSVAGTVAGATASAQANSCSGTDDDDVWFSFVAQGTGHTIQLTNISGSTTDMYFAVYSGACGSLTSILCSDAEANTVTGLTVGNTYYVRVYSYTSTIDQTSTFNICTFPLACATNDECSSATPLTVNPASACTSTTGGTVYCATASAQSTACTSGNDDDDVWYSFVATGSTHTVSLQNIAGSSTDMYFAVYSGTCGSLNSLVCSDANTQTLGGLTAGNTYYVRVYTYTSTGGQTTTFNICISSPDPDALCDAAKPFCSDTTYNFPTNTNSGSAPAGINYGCLCSQPNPIWYYLKIGTAGPMEIQIQSSCGDVDYAAWGPFATQTCDSLTNSGTFDYGGTTSTSCSVDNFESPSGNMIDCAYSTASTEYLEIPSAAVNEYYLVMINNYANCAGSYTFHQTTGTGKTDCIIVALPVGLYSFTSKCVSQNEVQLAWTTFTQYNNDYFEIQRMVNGSFVTIGTVDGAGNSNEMLQYTFNDFVNTDNVQYYRLRQYDFDGSMTDLKTIAADCNGELVFDINSASLDALSGNLEVNFTGVANQDYLINLMDLSGKTIFSDSFTATNDGKNQAVSYFKPLAQGVYVVSLTNKSGITKYSKVSPR